MNIAYLSSYLDFCLYTWVHVLELLMVEGWVQLHWPLRVLGSHLGADTCPGCAQHLAVYLCSPWSFGHWPCCRSVTSVPPPCSHLTAGTAVLWSLHLVDLFLASSNFLFSSVQNSLKHPVVYLKWSKSDLCLFLWFLPLGCIFSLSPFHDQLMVLPFISCPLILMQVLGTLVSNPSSDEGCPDFILCFVYSEVIYYILPIWWAPVLGRVHSS